MPFLAGAAVLAAIAWVYLVAGHGGFWRTDQRLPRLAGDPRWRPERWPSVVAVVPARDEAAILPLTLPSLLAQEYPGEFSVLLVDDGSTDGTAGTAVTLGAAAGTGGAAATGLGLEAPGPGLAAAAPGAAVRVVPAGTPPPGWAGKVHAMATGLAAAGDCDYVLFTDADISYAPGTLTSLVQAAVAGDRALVSQMALLRADTGWERLIVPAFVYFFAQLYPFRWVNRPGSRTAAAAGGCMLVRRAVLDAAGGLAPISAARIDDVALGTQLKRPPARARIWLGFSTEVRSRRPYPRLAGLWDMIARSAYVQLRYSPVLLGLTLIGLLWLYAVPPVAAVASLAGLAARAGGGMSGWAGPAAAWCATAGLAGWLLMSISFLPVLRLYRLGWWRAPVLPGIALLYAAMTADSARRHYAGRGGEWKGRTIPLGHRAD
ncbi:MAG: glycosyltransferase [Streptosporangiaceae bacterium]